MLLAAVVATITGYRRPIGTDMREAVPEKKTLCRHKLDSHDGQYRFAPLDLLFRDGEVIRHHRRSAN
jgi:hypothetical protein